MNYFSIAEFLIDPEMREGYRPVPLHVIDKIWAHHLPILNPTRSQLGCPVYISQNSGYRPNRWEIQKGRSGDSQHCFGDIKEDNEDCWGAVDLTCKRSMLDTLNRLLCDSEYSRVTWYPDKNFFHCDFKGSERLYFESDANNNWNLINRR